MDADVLYIIDASALIDLQKWRPLSKNRGVWQNLDTLIRDDRLMSPEEVYGEISEVQDVLAGWATRYKKRKQLFKKLSQQHVRVAKEIIHHYPELIDFDRPGTQADPFVIAFAYHQTRQLLKTERRVLVTNEKYTPRGRPRIPHVCEAYQVPYMTIHQMYVAERWTL